MHFNIHISIGVGNVDIKLDKVLINSTKSGLFEVQLLPNTTYACHIKIVKHYLKVRNGRNNEIGLCNKKHLKVYKNLFVSVITCP